MNSKKNKKINTKRFTTRQSKESQKQRKNNESCKIKKTSHTRKPQKRLTVDFSSKKMEGRRYWDI